VKLQSTIHLADRRPIELGPFTITPYLVDHSAYDSYAVLVEADGRRLFYSGDFRAHGRKRRLFEKFLTDPPADVDVLLMEGTCVGRASDHAFATEEELEARFVELFRQTPGLPLIWCSGQNIDRLVTVFKACRQARRQLIIDMYTAEILRATGNPRVPQADWDGMRVFLPASQKYRIIQEKAFDIANRYKPYRIYPEELAAAAATSAMLFRPSMACNLEAANCLAGAAVICSVWAGYLDAPFTAWLQDNDIPLHHCHTSGHASVADLQRLRNAVPTAKAVPVHLNDREGFATLFGNVELRGDGEWWEVM
jgi:ribonuclease J